MKFIFRGKVKSAGGDATAKIQEAEKNLKHAESKLSTFISDMDKKIEYDALQPTDFEEHRDKFPNAGGDIVNLVTNCMLAYYDNSFLSGSGTDRLMTRADVLKGLERYLANRNTDKKEDPPPFGMYL